MRPVPSLAASFLILSASVASALAGDDGRPMPTASNAGPSERAPVCVPNYKVLASKLQTSYAEVPVSAGIGQDGSLVSIFASPDTGTWTMVMTRPEGTTCVVAVGDNWEMKTAEMGKPPV